MRIRVVSWNIHGCVGLDRRFDPARTARALVALRPDVALLQEVGDSRGVHPQLDQADALASALGFRFAVGITLRASVHGYGNATLTRFRLLESESVDLSVSGREPRLGLRTVLDAGGQKLVTLNVHLGLGPEERRRQLRALLPAIDGALSPVVMGGDFNDFPPGPVSLTLRTRLKDAAARVRASRTFPSVWPLLRLDRLYLSHGLEVLSAYVDRAPETRAASDHLPVVVDCEVPDDSRRAGSEPPDPSE